ncbi:glycosyltransferase family 2 protein [Vibrio furnissii]|uniref:glycosyltransferase family 2 protein n=1 Tax=Vibrio furnissii TaxID=29494 RepID=UPI0021B0FDBF|nr:glycosyltransferase family 2 protein [Vibrio furnissii]
MANVVVKNNCKDKILSNYCKENNIDIIDDAYGLGFGENNNFCYRYFKKLGMRDEDLFLVFNPDIYIEPGELKKFIDIVNFEGMGLSTINLYLDREFKKYDHSIRHFPTLKTFILSFLGLGNTTIIDKSNINEIIDVDWGAGSFLCFQSSLYNELEGFDESYFMYCEDIDICYRSALLGNKLTYVPSVKAIHLAQHSNRNIFSKHFYWHVKSALKFILSRSFGNSKNKKSRLAKI